MRAAVILADVIVIVTTWTKMYHQVRITRDLPLRASTSLIMLTDGMATVLALEMTTMLTAIRESLFPVRTFSW